VTESGTETVAIKGEGAPAMNEGGRETVLQGRIR